MLAVSASHLPTRFVCVDEPDLQADDHDSEHEGRPVQMGVFAQQMPALIRSVIKDRGSYGSDRVSDSQRGEGINIARGRFCTNLINDIG